MKNAEATRKLLHAMNDFSAAYSVLKVMIDVYEQETGASVNDLKNFTEKYPFDKSFDELEVGQWVANVIDGVRQEAFKVLNYQYINTGGNTMVGIFDVWLPAKKQMVYMLTNEEGCTMSTVDYISNDLEIDNYDELMIEAVDWGRVTGREAYFELYRHCLNEYTKSDCKYFGITRQLPYYLLSDELQEMLDADYVKYIEAECGGLFETDGKIIVTNPDYEASEVDMALQSVKDFRRWHDSIAANEDYYNDWYTLEIHGRKVRLPFYAGIWNAVHDLLDIAIEEW